MEEGRHDRYSVGLQTEPLSLDAASKFVAHGNVGAIAIFVGATREFTEGRGRTTKLEYDCYPAMALEEMERLCARTLEDRSVERLYIVHRTGPVPVGESSVVVAASAAHRGEALDACRHLIDTLKRTVPIWKKEVYEGGKAEWVAGASGAVADG